jgi:hypothetical protein
LWAWCRLLVQQWRQARGCCNASCITRVLPLLVLLLYSLHLLHLLHLLLMWFHDDVVLLLVLLLRMH